MIGMILNSTPTVYTMIKITTLMHNCNTTNCNYSKISQLTRDKSMHLKAEVLFLPCLVCILSLISRFFFIQTYKYCHCFSYIQPQIFFWLQNHFSSSYFVFLFTRCVTPENIRIFTIEGIFSKTPCPLETPITVSVSYFPLLFWPRTSSLPNSLSTCLPTVWSHIHTAQLVCTSTHL